MTFFPDSTTFLNIGIFSIKWYAITMLTGALLTYFLTAKSIKKYGYSQNVIDDLFFGCFLSGIVGARIWYCLFYDFEYYFSSPIRILRINEGGLAIQGGLFLGALYGYYYCKKNKYSFLRLIDCIAPNILIAQAIGRWGNFVNQEAYGGIVPESFYNNFPAFIKERMYIMNEYRQPTFLWESGLNLLGFILINFVYKKYNRNKRGDMLYMYLVWYGITRFIVEGFRSDSLMFLNLRMAQVISILFVIVGALGIFGLFEKFIKKEKPVILFDLDGTILDTEKAILKSYEYLFSKYRSVEDFTKEVQIDVLGPSLKESFEKYFVTQEYETVFKDYIEHNLNAQKEYVEKMHYVEETLKYLKDNGYILGIVSTKYKKSVKFGLNLFNLEKYFDVILGGDEVENVKPDPEGILKACKMLNLSKDNCIYVGDSYNDIIAGKNAGVCTIGYIFNKDREAKLLSSNPNFVIDNYEEFTKILEGNKKSWTIDLM